MILIQLLSIFAYELDQPFIPGLIITKSNTIIPKEYDVKESGMKEYKNKEVSMPSNREYENITTPRFNPILRTILITRNGFNPLNRQIRHLRGFDEKDSPFVNEREPFNHDYPSNQSYYPFYYDHVPTSKRRVLSRSIEDVVKGKNGTLPSKSNGAVVLKILLILIFVLISGLIGFYLGKIQESKNYVRVGIPHNN